MLKVLSLLLMNALLSISSNHNGNTENDYAEVVRAVKPTDFNGCWDPYLKDKRRKVGEKWTIDSQEGRCCMATCKQCGSVDMKCRDESCSSEQGDYANIAVEEDVEARVADFNGCWDPHIKDKKRDVGEAWFRPHGTKECCKWSVCRAKGEVVNGCTKEACGFIPQSCKDETCSYKRFLSEVDYEADNDEEFDEIAVPDMSQCESKDYCELDKDPASHGKDCMDPDGIRRKLDEFWYLGDRGEGDDRACCWGVCKSETILFGCMKKSCFVVTDECKANSCAFKLHKDKKKYL